MALDHLEQAEFAENPEPRCPVILLLDTSGSMFGEPITELNGGLRTFEQQLKGDTLASLRVEVAVITFGGAVRVLDVSGGGQRDIPFDANQAFITADSFYAPVLSASGDTPMGEAVNRALTLLSDRKAIYKQNSIDYFRPWLMLITDGQPTDAAWEAASDAVKAEEGRKGVTLYAVGVEGANIQTLARFSTQRPPLKLKGLAFRELFQWLSRSLSAVAQSRPGEQVPLAPVGWAQVDTSR